MNETSSKVLLAARLSRLVKGKDQHRIERDDEAARRYAAEVGDTDPIVAADAGVSGSVSPFKRPKLAPYLDDARQADEWTELVASSIDRLGRNARDLHDLRSWCEDHGKRLTILSPRLHWPPDENDLVSPMVWDVLARIAEIELRMTKKRYADTREFLREQGSMIGRPCWGFRITGSKAAKTIEPVPAKEPYLLGMITRAEKGEPALAIARWLDSEGVKPAALEWWLARPENERGKRPSDRWDPKVVSEILRNESLYGVYRQNGTILLHHQGVIRKERWEKLQAKLDSNPKRRGPTRNDPMMLTDVLYCAACRRVMHARRLPGRPRKDGTRTVWVGYRCDGTHKDPSTCRNMIPADVIELWVDSWFYTESDGTTRVGRLLGKPGYGKDVFAFGDQEIREIVRIPAKGHADEVAEIDAEIDRLDKNSPDYLTEVTSLMAERQRLVALGTEPAHTEERPTGIKLRDYWPTLDTAGKRDYLMRAGLKIYATKDEAEITGDPSQVVGALAVPAPE